MITAPPKWQARSNFPPGTPGGAAGAFTDAAPALPPGPFEVGLVVRDVPAAYSRAVGAGAVPWAPPSVKPWGQGVAYVRDLNGMLVELCTPIGSAPQPPAAVRFFWVDSFAEEVGAGNPAAVVVIPDGDGAARPWPAASAMQRIAAENGLSETAFVRRLGDGGRWGLRWFTPEVEVDLCGQCVRASPETR